MNDLNLIKHRAIWQLDNDMVFLYKRTLLPKCMYLLYRKKWKKVNFLWDISLYFVCVHLLIRHQRSISHRISHIQEPQFLLIHYFSDFGIYLLHFQYFIDDVVWIHIPLYYVCYSHFTLCIFYIIMLKHELVILCTRNIINVKYIR